MSAPTQTGSTGPAASSFNYQHNVETCACGTCHKARVDSGTSDAYLKRCKEAAEAVTERLKRQKTFLFEQVPTSQDLRLAHYGLGSVNADVAIAKAAAASGGSVDHPDFAKNLFSAMGTPHDSKCPHGLPFYACRTCSH